MSLFKSWIAKQIVFDFALSKDGFDKKLCICMSTCRKFMKI